MEYKSAVEFINSYTKSGKPINNLDRIKKLMKKLGDPQSSLSFVHVAGTNGKGSIVEMVSTALIDSGLKVGQFTSPYIVCLEDRIRINGENIAKQKLSEFADIVKNSVENDSYSQFEIIFAIAMLYYKSENVDIVCLEAGLGGLLDCTNVIDCPKVAVIGSISLDHTDILGKTVRDIAVQKAGIVKQGGVAVVSSQNDEEILDVFKKHCENIGARLIVPKNAEITQGNSFIYKGVNYAPCMKGEHQAFNALAAIETLDCLSQYYVIKPCNIQNGINNARVRARFEKISQKHEVYFDGAHNPDAVLRLKNTLLQMEGQKIAVVGMIGSKDAKSAISQIADCFESVICVDGFYPNAIDRFTLAELFAQSGTRAYTSTLENASENTLMLAADNKIVIVFGSLYLYSHIAEYFE